jgi:dTDP-4-dehydrorhamnose reductase
VENILFFGASGRLGRNWVKDLVKKNKIYANIHIDKKLFKSNNLYAVELDLKKPKKIISFCDKNKISIIINCVGVTDVELCEINPTKVAEVNWLIPSKLCKIAKKLEIPIVHISTDMLFNGKSNKKYDEKSRYSPLNTYSKTKVKAEKILLNYKKSLIIRTNFFGFSNNKNKTITDKLIYEQKLKKKSFLWNDVYFTPMYIPNLIFFINLLIKNYSKGIYNISSDECMSKFDFGLKVTKGIIKNNKIFPNNFNKKNFTNRPINMCLSNNKLKKKFPKYANKLKFNFQRQCFFKDYKLINYE